MAWKKDDEGHFIADANGNPVWATESGEDKSVDYPALTKRISEVNAESKGRKDEIRQMKERYALFDGIEDLAAWHDEAVKAIEAVKNTPEKDKEIEAQISGRIEAATSALKSQLADREKKIGEKDKALAEMTAKLHGMFIKANVHSSKVLAERIKPEDRPFIERELVRAGAVDEDGKVFYRYDNGETIYGEDGNATADEAVVLIMKKLGVDPATKLMSQNGTNGSGGNPNLPGGAPGMKNPWKKESWNVTEQCRIMSKDPSAAERMRKAAGF